ncbi:hypothetical protein FGIG_02680 [Fasciola gigantica]|uniref:Uncharacterized protein n=1 Tax=Fasciola gigantica TaxID=46835 RepID=A0A504YMG0_FASGI|nr:hypothetical protein FGIG_02680 [Fasciola gigantica]
MGPAPWMRSLGEIGTMPVNFSLKQNIHMSNRYAQDVPDADLKAGLNLFCGASEAKYCALSCLRYLSDFRQFSFVLVTAKYRVSPLQTVTTPPAELTAALLRVEEP